MPPDSNEICFRGENATECEEFVRKVYTRAWNESHTQDSTWIANFVSTCLGGKALRWYAKLPRETRRDWDLLQLALFETWPPQEDEAKPYPAAASPPSAFLSFRYSIGRLRAKVKGDNARYWVSTKTRTASTDNKNGFFILTHDSTMTLHVQLIPMEGRLWRLKILNHPSGCNFVAFLLPGTWEISYGMLIGVDVPEGASIRDYRSTYRGINDTKGFKSDFWKFDAKEKALSINPKSIDKVGGSVYMMKSSADGLLLDENSASGDNQEIELFFELLDP